MIDPMRHLEVFSPHKFGDRRVDVIGAGATGSRIILSLAKLGIQNIHAWDFDHVEQHNIANQAFFSSHIGKSKLEAINELVLQASGYPLTCHDTAVGKDTAESLGEVVFLLTDTMQSRRDIWEACLKYRPQTRLMIETRMGANTGRVYSVRPYMPNHVSGWESTLYDDAEAAVSACGASTTVGATAEIISGLAVWQMLRWFEDNSDIDNEVIFSLQPTMTLSRNF